MDTQSFSIRLNRTAATTANGPPSSGAQVTSSVSDQQQAIKSFLHQKPHRIHHRVLKRKAIYITLTSLAMFLAWVIGFCGYSYIYLIMLLGLMFVLWRDLSKRFTEATKHEIEMTVRRKKAMQLSETAEWVNMAINRWWMTCNESVFAFFKDYAEPLLQEVIPVGIDNIELVEFDLANQTPFVKNIQIFDPPNFRNVTPEREFRSSSASNTKAVIVANIDIGLVAPDSKLVLKARVGGKKIGYNTLVYIEGLHLSGSMQAIIHFDYNAPFPHVGWISATFTRKPDLWFTIRVLKGLKVTEIPLVKSFVHSLIMNIFQSLLVDPGRLEIDLMSSGPKSMADFQSSRRARSVLTVTFTGNPPQVSSKYEDDPRRWVVFSLGKQKYKLKMPVGRESWKVTYSFLVYDIKEDVLTIKVKHYRVMYTMTLAMHTISLSTLGLVNEAGDEVKTSRNISVGSTEANIGLDIEYTPLPPFSLNSSPLMPVCDQVAGVLYVHVHSAVGLRSGDMDGLSDPYCVVLANKKKILTTHYILDTLEPKWERGVELFVSDFTQLSLTFIVYDWDGPLVGDDLLGTCQMTLEIDKPYILQKQFELEIDGSSAVNGSSFGQLTVSVIFRDVESVAKSELEDINTSQAVPSQVINSTDTPVAAKVNPKQAWKKLKGLGGLLPGENFGIIELSLIEGKDLVAMDRNGFSDPYIIVKYGMHEMYRTHFITKSLNPKWNCHCTLSAPPPDAPIVIECWDKDQFTNDDFMGSIAFTANELNTFENGPRWCKLQHVANGEIFLELKKIDHSQDSLSSGDLSQLDLKDKASLELATEETESGLEQPVPMINLQGNPSPSRSMSPSYSSPHIPQHFTPSPPPSNQATGALSPLQNGAAFDANVTLRRRSTAGYPSHYRHSVSPSLGSADSSLSTHSADTESLRGRRRDTAPAAQRHSALLESSAIPQQTSLYYNVAGEIIEAEGLKGKLGDLMLYIKVRLNSRPSHLRRQKFDRGPVLHKSQALKGSSSLIYNETFIVKDSPIPSESLLTIDLKSGPKVTLGTHIITLDRFFEGNIKTTKWLDLGNNMRILMKLSHRPPHARSLDIPVTPMDTMY